MRKATSGHVARTAMFLVCTVMLHAPSAAQDCPDCGCMDVVLVIDDTSSMRGAIDNVKDGLEDIIEAAGCASRGDVRVGLVSFKDTIDVDQPLTSNLNEVEGAVAALGAIGGGREPEASDEALNLTVTGASACSVGQPRGALGGFRAGCTRIAVLVTDARPGGCDDRYVDGVDDTSAANVADAAAANGIFISAVLVDNGSYESDAHPDGVEPDVMAHYASTTEGVFMTVPGNGDGTGAAIADILATCGNTRCEDGLRLLDGTPLEGFFSRFGHETLEPPVGGVDPSLEAALHDVLCDFVHGTVEETVDDTLP